MNIQNEVQQLVEEACIHNTGKTPPPGISDADIDAFASRLGIAIPLSLRKWLRFSNAPPTGFGIVFGITPGNANFNIEDCYPEYLAYRRNKGWIPIANDGCGNDFVLATKAEDGPGHPVFFLETLTDEKDPVYVVASDLWHFFRFYIRKSLHECGRAYNDEWPFNKEKVLAMDPELNNYTKYPLPWDVA